MLWTFNIRSHANGIQIYNHSKSSNEPQVKGERKAVMIVITLQPTGRYKQSNLR